VQLSSENLTDREARMRRDIEISAGDICGDATGLRVKVEEVDPYDYVHFSVVERSENEEDEVGTGEMSHLAFVRRFTRMGPYIC
jgi:hypothetical protein